MKKAKAIGNLDAKNDRNFVLARQRTTYRTVGAPCCTVDIRYYDPNYSCLKRSMKAFGRSARSPS